MIGTRSVYSLSLLETLLQSGTVLSYLGTAIENGYPVEWSRLGISEEEYNMVVEAIDALSPTGGKIF